MPIPLLPLIGVFALGNVTKKNPRKQAVSKHTKKSGTKVKAYTRRAK
jgi:hypothetical protein